MRILIRPLAVTGAALLAAAGTAAGITAASGATTRREQLAVTRSAPAVIPKLSHQLCYTSVARGFKPAPVLISDLLSPHGFVPKIGPAVLNCNPVIKTVNSPAGPQVFPITYPAGHLACFAIREAKQPVRPLTVINQFGSGLLTPGQPKLLCLPTWKSLRKPPQKAVVEPPFLDHFTCYSVSLQAGKFTVPPLMLQDEFAAKPVTPDVRPVPVLMCLATRKVAHHHVYRVVHPGAMLVCFPVGPTPIKTPVFDQNQFGHATVIIKKASLLCLPSHLPGTPPP